MTITREWQCGFETGTALEISNNNGCTIGTASKKSGSYSIGFGVNGNNFTRAITPTRQLRLGGWHNPNNVACGLTTRLIAFRNSAGTELIRINGQGATGGGALTLFVAGSQQDQEGGVNAGTAFYHIGVDIKIHASAGWVVVYKDSTEIMRFEGNTGNADITDFISGHTNNQAVAGTIYWDDMFIDNSINESAPAPVPQKRFPYLTCNAVGYYDGGAGQLLGSDGNQVNNYQLVDEVPADAADYVYAGAADLIDSYNMTGYNLAGSEGCIAMIPTVLCQRAGGTEQIALGTRYDSLDAIGDDKNPPGSYGLIFERQINKPDGNPWDSDQTAINGVEIIIKSRGTYS